MLSSVRKVSLIEGQTRSGRQRRRELDVLFAIPNAACILRSEAVTRYKDVTPRGVRSSCYELLRRESVRLMEGEAEECREQPEKGQDETAVSDALPTGNDDPSIPTDVDPGEAETEPPPDWLEPLEDCEDEGDEGGEIEKSSGQRGRTSKNATRKRGRPSVSSSSLWVDCPPLGNDWKRKVIFWRAGKTATYYLSPKGVRIRSKVQLAKHLKLDLSLFDYKEGIFVDALKPRKRRKARVKEVTRRSHLSSRVTTRARNRTPENLTVSPQNGPLSPQTPQLIPIQPSTSPPLNSSYRSPPELTRVSPTILQQPSPSPSLKLDDLSVQTNSISHSWLHSSLAPVSPTKSPESDFSTCPNGQNAMKDSPYLHSPPPIQLIVDPDGGMQDHGLPPLEGCANCGRKYPGMGKGKQLLCPKCRPGRNQQPHIVFKKVGQDRWILGNSENDISIEKQIFPPLGRRRQHSRSLRLMAQQETEKKAIKNEMQQDSDDEDDGPDAGPDDDDDYGPRKRKRRMCGQCKACLREENCGKCDFCLDKTRYGGPNKLRQKCRFRQCQLRSRLQTGSLKYARSVGLVESGQGEPSSRKHGRHWGRRRMKHRSRSNRHCMDDENDDDGKSEVRRSSRKGQRGRPKKYARRQRVKDEGPVKRLGPEIEEDGAGDLEQDPFVVCDDGSSGFYESEELYSNNYLQNGTDMVQNRDHQPVQVEYTELPQCPELVYTVPGLPDGSQLLSSVLPNGVPLQLDAVPGTHVPLVLNDVPRKSASQQHTEVLSSNATSLRLSDFLRNHGLELVEVDTTIQQMVLPAPTSQEPECQGESGTLDASPEIYSLPDSTERSSMRDPALLELLTSLRRTILPAHWVGVMANGPILQLFQCSKLSPMADTVLQIEPDFLYQISVQNQPLLPTHAVYERHPDRLASVSQVVTLLIDLEELNVCQGYQSFEANSQREPLLCARAALCQLLVPQDEDCCDKCQECNPVITS